MIKYTRKRLTPMQAAKILREAERVESATEAKWVLASKESKIRRFIEFDWNQEARHVDFWLYEEAAEGAKRNLWVLEPDDVG